MVNLDRKSGILLHITSLPGPYGIGEIGPKAFEFVDDLNEMGQCLWQILPNNPPDNHNCPYSTTSAFANNPILISFDYLVRDGWLESSDLLNPPSFEVDRVNFDLVKQWRWSLLLKAASTFRNNKLNNHSRKFKDYCDLNDFWLNNYSMFTVLEQIQSGKDWIDWEPKYKSYSIENLKSLKESHSEEIEDIKILQYLFDSQWAELKEYANSNGIQIIGDIPIYVAFNSADVWTNQSLFKLTKLGNMRVQSGCPPDFFIETGQTWGHPIYDWAEHKKEKYKWWTDRIAHLFQRVDMVRIDHFNGFAKYWEVPAEDDNGINGHWVPGPGEGLFNAIIDRVGSNPILAEDLGEASKDAAVLRKTYGIPGMKILQMSFGNGTPFKSMSENTVVYTGTHDNDTCIGWYFSENGDGTTQSNKEILKERIHAKNVLKLNDIDVNWRMVEYSMKSNANTAIFPMQDILGMDSSARMNTPGTIGGNWEWRYNQTHLNDGIKHRLKKLTKETQRI